MTRLTMLILMLSLGAQAEPKQILLTTDNTVSINSPISRASVDEAIEEIIDILNSRESNESVYIVLNSPGGSIIDGIRFIDFVNTLENIHTICIYCASMAHAISQGVKGIRYATPKNLMMAHRARGGFSGQFESGEVETRLKVFKALVKSLEKQNADRIGISLKEYKSKVVDEWWTFGEDSVKQNIIDEIVTIKCSMDLINTKKSSSQMSIFGLIKGPEKSACPLT